MTEKEKWKMPPLMTSLFLFLLGACLRTVSINMFTGVYLMAFGALFVLPYSLILNEDRKTMNDVKKLVHELEAPLS